MPQPVCGWSWCDCECPMYDLPVHHACACTSGLLLPTLEVPEARTTTTEHRCRPVLLLLLLLHCSPKLPGVYQVTCTGDPLPAGGVTVTLTVTLTVTPENTQGLCSVPQSASATEIIPVRTPPTITPPATQIINKCSSEGSFTVAFDTTITPGTLVFGANATPRPALPRGLLRSSHQNTAQ